MDTSLQFTVIHDETASLLSEKENLEEKENLFRICTGVVFATVLLAVLLTASFSVGYSEQLQIKEPHPTTSIRRLFQKFEFREAFGRVNPLWKVAPVGNSASETPANLGISVSHTEMGCVSHFPFLCKFIEPVSQPPQLNLSTRNAVTLSAYAVQQKIHPHLPASSVHAIGESQAEAAFPGPTLIAVRHVPALIHWKNEIPHNLMFQRALTKDPSFGRLAMHLHGGEVEPGSMGHPRGRRDEEGPNSKNFETNLYTYANGQEPATLWYHTHSFGSATDGVLSGLGGFYQLLDPPGLEANLEVPRGESEAHFMIQDGAVFANGTFSSLNPKSSAVPTLNVVMVNGKVWPFMKVRRTAYTFHLLNAYSFQPRVLAFTFKNRTLNAEKVSDETSMKFYQIASDGGLLNSPIETTSLTLGPSERARIVIDFSSLPHGVNEVYLADGTKGDSSHESVWVAMKFIVGQSEREGEKAREKLKLPLRMNDIVDVKEENVTRTRSFSITREVNGEGEKSGSDGSEERRWVLESIDRLNEKEEEVVEEGTSEIWSIFGAYESAALHMLHLHFGQHQLLGRRKFDLGAFRAGLCASTNQSELASCLSGPVERPRGFETGWKDTFQVEGGVVTSIWVKISNQAGKAFPFDPTAEPGYMWTATPVGHVGRPLVRTLRVVSRSN